MVPILRIFNDIWVKASRAIRVSVVSQTSVQAVVDDAVSNTLPGTVQALSLTSDGRLRVATQPEIDSIEMTDSSAIPAECDWDMQSGF